MYVARVVLRCANSWTQEQLGIEVHNYVDKINKMRPLDNGSKGVTLLIVCGQYFKGICLGKQTGRSEII